jgi:hypothetical protein
MAKILTKISSFNDVQKSLHQLETLLNELNKNLGIISSIQTSIIVFQDNDTSLMTAAAIADKIEGYGYSTTAVTNLTKTVSGSGYSINSSTGDNIALSLADTDNWGLMSDEMFDTLAAATSNTGTVTSVGTTGTVNGLTLTGTVTTSGNLTLGGTLAINNGDWSGTALADGNIASASTWNSLVTNVSTALSVGTNNTTELSITSDGGADDVTLPVATTSLTGVMNSAMFDKLDGIASNANNYSHPTGNGNNHIPADGSAGQFLKYSSAGTAVWAADNDTTYSVMAVGNSYAAGLVAAGSGTHGSEFLRKDGTWVVPTNTTYSEATSLAEGLMSTAHHDKLDGIEASATADQTKSDIDGLAITTVGTIDTGTWQGTAINQTYLTGQSGTNTGDGTYGIADTNYVKIDSSTVADDEYARFTANGLESRSVSEVLSDIGAQASGSYITGSGSLSAQDLTDIGNLSGTNTGDQTLPANYLRDDADDTTTGTITAGGFTTTGTWTMDTSAGGTTGITNINITNAFTDDDVTIMSAGAIKEKIEGYGYTTNTGDMTGVDLTGGTGISIDSETNTTSGAYSSTITCNLEGTELISTGEGGGSKFLREDGDGTCSWQTVSASGNFVTDNADDTMAGTLTIDKDYSVAAAGNTKGLLIDLDRTGNVASGVDWIWGMQCLVDVSGSSNHAQLIYGIECKVDADDMGSGISTAAGLNLVVEGTADTSYGILNTTVNGGIDYMQVSSADSGDYFSMVTTTHGATTLTTVDDDAAAAHLNIEADGHVEFDGCGVGFDLVTPTFNAADTNVDFKTGNKQMVTLTDNIADLNLTFPATSGNFTILLKQDGTGSRTMAADGWLAFEHDGTAATVPAVKFPGGTAPTLTTAANHVDIVSFFWDADNQVCYGVASLDFQD